nr:MAG TPA: hypothetical protein [Caudoviricetes sp.]
MDVIIYNQVKKNKDKRLSRGIQFQLVNRDYLIIPYITKRTCSNKSL